MDRTTKLRPSRKANSEYEAELTHLFEEFDRVQERILASRSQAERVRAETEEIKSHTRSVLQSMGATL